MTKTTTVYEAYVDGARAERERLAQLIKAKSAMLFAENYHSYLEGKKDALRWVLQELES